MPRIRTIQPFFPRSASMARVNRDARLLFVLLWTLADDEGRLRADPRLLIGMLFSCDADAPELLPLWLEALAREGCIERYAVGEEPYLRIVNWHAHQAVDRPTPSRLPASPEERRLRASRRAREGARLARERNVKRLHQQDFSGELPESREDFENRLLPVPIPVAAAPTQPRREIDSEFVMDELRESLVRAKASEKETAVAHVLQLMGRGIGMWRARAAGKPRASSGVSSSGVSSADIPSSGPSLATFHGRPERGVER